MDYVRMARPARPNLSAGGLTSYGFAIEAAIGRRPMRYLVGRRFVGPSAVTGLFVLLPQILAGSHVWITENSDRGECEVETHIPTMKNSVRPVERYLFDCLPLTDIGYLDLMAWRYPGLGATPEDVEVDMSWSRWSAAEPRCYLGPVTTPGLTVTEAVDHETGMVVARAVDRLREPFRRWEVVEMGRPDVGGLPERVRASRTRTGGWTDFRRVGEPVPVPREAFDAGPARLREALEHGLSGKAA
ncbi:hypothetical protein AB0C84_26165 [Actinomadura sp. NPDC048955]|uniref:hypothetical protein n=1 Tax=Actinomadura TaxID=1988 RepID=UPI002164EB4C|nr:hypothetical protein [Actinomadura glauciflava]